MKLEDYIQHLKSRGYKINGNKASIGTKTYTICEGYAEAPWGKRENTYCLRRYI